MRRDLGREVVSTPHDHRLTSRLFPPSLAPSVRPFSPSRPRVLCPAYPVTSNRIVLFCVQRLHWVPASSSLYKYPRLHRLLSLPFSAGRVAPFQIVKHQRRQSQIAVISGQGPSDDKPTLPLNTTCCCWPWHIFGLLSRGVRPRPDSPSRLTMGSFTSESPKRARPTSMLPTRRRNTFSLANDFDVAFSGPASALQHSPRDSRLHPPRTGHLAPKPSAEDLSSMSPLLNRPGLIRRRFTNLSCLTAGVRRLYHRACASTSIHPKQSTMDIGTKPFESSTQQIEQSRPETSWHRRAASIAHLSRPASTFFSSAATSPRNEPKPFPVKPADQAVNTLGSIPGAAARAAAAAQNGRVGVGRVIVMKGESKVDRDAESGIGIEVRGFADDPGRGGNADLSIVRKGRVPTSSSPMKCC